MGLKDVAPNILEEWVNQFPLPDNASSPTVAILQMSEADQAASLLAFLQSEIANDQAEIDGLPQSVADETAMLQADIQAMNDAIAALNGK